jgi:hypothetical protein
MYKQVCSFAPIIKKMLYVHAKYGSIHVSLYFYTTSSIEQCTLDIFCDSKTILKNIIEQKEKYFRKEVFFFFQKGMEIKGFEPLTFSMRSRRSTTDLYPRL